jgi:hypothetical protein
LTGDPIANIKLLEDPGKNLVVIMKDGKVYKNTCDACRLPLAALSRHCAMSPICPLLGEERTWRGLVNMSANDR